ncbi:hypothetical protein ACFRK5_00025 [Streptomyces niveus]|uniref:hypothetical protein n=1 Tax=Streptomyces niveus TaxID=193462 RepID=UPI003681987D
MYRIDQLSNAVGQLTGESLEGARQRLGGLQRFDQLIPTASADQALLESVLASALGTADGQTRPFGVREAKPVGENLVLRLERTEDVQALLDLLPYRTQRGSWRGVRGLFVQVADSRLQFGFRTWLYERNWRSLVPTVWVAGPHEDDLAALLAAHEQRLAESRHTAQWDPQCPEPGPKRQPPITRSLVRRLSASYAMGSALLRRPRLWDSLAGCAGVRVETEMSDYGLDWIVERLVSYGHFDDNRLIEVLTDQVVGCSLRLLSHDCGTQECSVRLAPPPAAWGWRGVLTIRSHQAPAGPHLAPHKPRPLTAIGGSLNVSRRSANTRNTEQGDEADKGGSVIRLTKIGRSGAVHRDDLAWVAEQLASVWAAQGLAAAVITTENRSSWRLFRDPGQPTWATASVPNTTEGWRRLRIVPAPGELWSLSASTNDEGAAALVHARRTFDRVFLVGRFEQHLEKAPLNPSTDAHILVHSAEPYERSIQLPAEGGVEGQAVPLTPAESAVHWRQQELGGWTPQRPLTGVLLLGHHNLDEETDEFDRAVEDQLGRYGTRVLGRFPANRPIIVGRRHSPHPPTVLDPETEQPTHAQMVSAANNLASRLWPGTLSVIS